jgi:murein DD-endopeptidase MepM/ murein hydrolase activator NlpD
MRLFKALLIVLILIPLVAFPVQAQQADPPVYIVQPGDTLISIAFRFGISADDLISVNSLEDANNLHAGDQLILPGLEGIHGTLTTQPVGLGESLREIARRSQVTQATMIQLNHLTSPSELYAGASLILPQQRDGKQLSGSADLTSGQSLLELAIVQGVDPWQLQAQNNLVARWAALPGDTLYYPSAQVGLAVGGIAPSIESVEISPLPLVQGKTIEIKVKTRSAVALSGSLLNHDLHFAPLDENTAVALAGVYAIQNPGLYPIRLSGKQSDGTSFDFEQMILVDPGYYPSDPRLQVDPATIDPKVTVPEAEQIAKITSPFTPDRFWNGIFLSPGYDPKWITSWYGNRRTYNEDPTVTFHAGIDYGGGVGLPIKAPAAGVVVYTGLLTVRGNATIIDHGWGVYSGFWHQSQIDVKVGDHVTPGQVIGLIGGTGRVTGAHLHWEIWVNGVQVDPLDWLGTVYP